MEPSHVTLVVNREGGPNPTVGTTGNQISERRTQFSMNFYQNVHGVPRNLRSPHHLVSWGGVPLLRPRPFPPDFPTVVAPYVQRRR